MRKYSPIILFVIAASFTLFAQVNDIGISFEKKAYVQEMDLKRNFMLVTYVDKGAIYTEKLTIENNPEIEIDKKKGSLKDLRYGMEVTVVGEYFETQNLSKATRISASTQYGNSAVIDRGRLDAIVGEYAYVDGNRIKLGSSKKITGIKKSGYKDKTFGKFTELKLGSFASVKGKFTPQGYLIADEFAVAPQREKDDEVRNKQDLGSFEEPIALWSNASGRTSLLGTPLSQDANVLDNADVQEYIYRVTQNLTPKNLEEKIQFTIIVTDELKPEAYSLPNGMIYLSKGMLFEIYNEAQLAGILAHEMAHVIYEHGAARFFDNEKAVDKKGNRKKTAGHITDALNKFKPKLGLKDKNGKQIFSKYIGAKSSDILIRELPTAAELRMLSQHSIEEELQADRVGLTLMFLAGYNPCEAAIVWKNRFNSDAKAETRPVGNSINPDIVDPLKKDGDLVDLGFDYFNNALLRRVDNINTKSLRTHPDHKKRFEEINKLIDLYYSDPESISKLNVNEAQYQDMIRVFKAAEDKRRKEIENERKKKTQFDKQYKSALPKIKQKLTSITKPLLTYKSYSLKPVVDIVNLVGKNNCTFPDIQQQINLANNHFKSISGYVNNNLTEIKGDSFDPADKDQAFAMNYLLSQKANEFALEFAAAVSICDYERAKEKNPSVDKLNNLIIHILDSKEYTDLVNTLSTK